MSSEPIVLDPASGSRMFYFDKADPRVVFGDIRSESHTLCDGRSLIIEPDVQMDFRAIPYPPEHFRVVVLDPPHLQTLGEHSWMAKKYGRLDRRTWPDDLRKGFSECFRVLVCHGVLIFKWNESDIRVGDVLSLTPERPLIFQRAGKGDRTCWVVFVKEGLSCAMPEGVLNFEEPA